MGIINCPECKNQVSTTADKCPNCGYNFKKIKRNKGCGIALIALLLLFFYIVYSGSASEEKREENGIALKNEHCKVEWEKLTKIEKERVLNEFMDNALYIDGINAPEVIIKKLLRSSTKYPGTVDEEHSPLREIKDIQKGIIEYQNPFTAENKLGLKVKGHYWLKVKYNAGCKSAEILSFDVE